MGWRLPPREREKHRVILELAGPIDKKSFSEYRKELEQVVKKHGARLAAKKLVKKPTKRPAKKPPYSG